MSGMQGYKWFHYEIGTLLWAEERRGILQDENKYCNISQYVFSVAIPSTSHEGTSAFVIIDTLNAL